MSQRHKVFISYHHANDEPYRIQFEHLFTSVTDILVSHAVQDGDIDLGQPVDAVRQAIRDRYIRDASVTVVLVGAKTWQRKHVDWEISASLRHTAYNSRNGLLGILLPSYRAAYPKLESSRYNPKTIPPRLHDNLSGSSAFAKLYEWTTNASSMQTWIHEAFVRRDRQPDPDNSRVLFARNWNTDEWQ